MYILALFSIIDYPIEGATMLVEGFDFKVCELVTSCFNVYENYADLSDDFRDIRAKVANNIDTKIEMDNVVNKHNCAVTEVNKMSEYFSKIRLYDPKGLNSIMLNTEKCI